NNQATLRIPMKSRLLGLALFAAIMLVAAPAFADPSWNFGQYGSGALTNNGCAGTCVAFTSGIYELDVTGWTSNGVQDQLFYKNNGGDEVGLGLVGTLDNEIVYPTNFLQLDISKLFAAGVNSI